MAASASQLIYSNIWIWKSSAYRFWGKFELAGWPQSGCLLISNYFAPPWKPNSAWWWVVQGLLKGEKERSHLNAFVPVITPGKAVPLVLYSWVLVSGRGPSDLPCVHYWVVCGPLDHKADYGWLWWWSKYGLKWLTMKKTLEEFYSMTDKKWEISRWQIKSSEDKLMKAAFFMEDAKQSKPEIMKWHKLSSHYKIWQRQSKKMIEEMEWQWDKELELELKETEKAPTEGPSKWEDSFFLELQLNFFCNWLKKILDCSKSKMSQLLNDKNYLTKFQSNLGRFFFMWLRSLYLMNSFDKLLPLYSKLLWPWLYINNNLNMSNVFINTFNKVSLKYNMCLWLYSTPLWYFNYDMVQLMSYSMIKRYWK